MNTGIGDAVDLGWKLAAVVQGWGGPNLLASYDTERRPIGLRNIDKTAGFHLAHGKFDDGFAAIEDDTEAGRALRAASRPRLVREVGAMFRTIGLQLGYRYEDSPIIVAGRHAAGAGRSGELRRLGAPRLARAACGARRRPLDARLYGRGFVLLRFGAERRMARRFEAAAQNSARAAADRHHRRSEAAAIYERKLVLVRPDGHVAWRGSEMPADAGAVIDYVRGTLHFVRA